MTDITERLRMTVKMGLPDRNILDEAADEIERLRALSENNAKSWDAIVRERDELRAERKMGGGVTGKDKDMLIAGALHDLAKANAENERLRAALRQVVSNIEDYERINNLAPNPGRKYCWDSVAHAHDVLGDAP